MKGSMTYRGKETDSRKETDSKTRSGRKTKSLEKVKNPPSSGKKEPEVREYENTYLVDESKATNRLQTTLESLESENKVYC